MPSRVRRRLFMFRVPPRSAQRAVDGFETKVLKVTLSEPVGVWMASLISHQPVMLNFMPSIT